LLSNQEIEQLVSAQNRNEFIGLEAFLYATNRLMHLRKLNLPAQYHYWEAPQLKIDEQGLISDLQGYIRGYQKSFPLPMRPGEPQMAISYDWFWDKFCRFLQEKEFWALKYDTELFVICPVSNSLDIESLWQEFWSTITSKDFLNQSLTMFLDNKTLFKQQASPWSSKDIPILSKEMAEFLINYYQYGPGKRKHFKQKSIPKAIDDLQNIISNREYTNIPWPNVLDNTPIKGGDSYKGRKSIPCAGCGQRINKKESFKRLAVFLKDADERSQSGRDKDDLTLYCKLCVAMTFLCPVKLTKETLSIKFPIEKRQSKFKRPTDIELSKYVAQTLNIHAGNYINLHIQEAIDRKPLLQILGAYHYTLWKVAVTFPPETFTHGFAVQAFPGEESFSIPNWSLWFVSSLADLDQVFQYSCYAVKEKRQPFFQFLRLVSSKKVFHALYVLLSEKIIHDYSRSWKINKIQEIWNDFERILKKEDKMPIPDYPRIIGFAGLLLPLAERVAWVGKKGEEEKKRAVSKLLEEVDRPIQYAYTAARESGSSDFIFCKQTRNRYFFDKAMQLLQEAGEDVAALKEAGKQKGSELIQKQEAFSWIENAEEKIFLGPDQIARVTSYLVSEDDQPYANEADWRAFAYQVKLALWSMFPRYLSS
jgi:hypothetical protein